MKLYIQHDGDASVGIPGDYLVLDWPRLDHYEPEYLVIVKETLATFFRNLLDFRVRVLTEEEAKAEDGDPWDDLFEYQGSISRSIHPDPRAGNPPEEDDYDYYADDLAFDAARERRMFRK